LSALALIAILAVVSILASEMPRAFAWPLCVTVLVCGGFVLRREARRPVREVSIDASGHGIRVDGVLVESWRLHWRGPLAFAEFRLNGKRERLSWWPDTLPPARRRELRLAASSSPVSSERQSMPQ
jgi:toxin CptA